MKEETKIQVVETETSKEVEFKKFITHAELQLSQLFTNFYKVRVKVGVILSGTIIKVYLGEEIQPSLTLVIGRNYKTKLFGILEIKINKGSYELDNAKDKEVLILAGSISRNMDVLEKKALYYSYQYHKRYQELNSQTI